MIIIIFTIIIIGENKRYRFFLELRNAMGLLIIRNNIIQFV